MCGFAAYKAEVLLAWDGPELWWMHDLIVLCWNEGWDELSACYEIARVANEKMREMV